MGGTLVPAVPGEVLAWEAVDTAVVEVVEGLAVVDMEAVAAVAVDMAVAVAVAVDLVVVAEVAVAEAAVVAADAGDKQTVDEAKVDETKIGIYFETLFDCFRDHPLLGTASLACSPRGKTGGACGIAVEPKDF